jgi:phenylacetaldehyde dehydrogenase
MTPATPAARAFLGTPAHRLWIGGAWQDAAHGTFATHDPATGAVIGHVARAGAEEADGAVAAARAALTRPEWAEMSPARRGALLWRIADLLEAEADALAEVEVLDQGKTLATAHRAEIPGAIGQFRYHAGIAQALHGQTIRPSTPPGPGRRLIAETRPEPVGVVAAIVPWNSPLLMAAMKLAPALAAGCTVVLKPAEQTPLSALWLADLMHRAGLPAGVVNVVTGYGHEVGAALAAHPGVDKVAFTGSTATGRALLVAVQGNLKKLTLELGGKSPAVVMADADLSIAVPGVARGIFANAGQVCVAGSRVYVARTIADRFLEGLAEEARRLRLGHGLAPDTDLGPLVGPDHAARVAAIVDEGRADGATVLTGGARAPQGPAFYTPTVITDVRPDMALMRQEIFGPVTAVTVVDDPADAIRMANDTDYGLAASVWTEDLSTAHRMAAAIRAGTVWVNCHSVFGADLPKGGMRQSGWGVENGTGGVFNYLQMKTVCLSV